MAFLLLAISCSSTSQTECENGEVITLKDFTGLDGCRWMLVTEENKSLEPMNLEDFISEPKEDEKYRIEYSIRNDLASICLVGSIVEITCATKQ